MYNIYICVQPGYFGKFCMSCIRGTVSEEIIMKKRSAALLLAVLMVLPGCGGIEKAEESTVTVNDKGIVTEALVEDFLSEEYDKNELETSVKELVDAYNKQAGQEDVILKKLQVEDGKARVLIQYETDEAYRGFNQLDFFAGTVQQAKDEGYAFAGDFTDAEGKDISSGILPDKCTDQQVIIIREPLCVLVPGKILYVSKNMEILGKDQARLASDSGITYENAQTTTEAYGYVVYSAK